jgi:hypothetical protein
MKKTMISVSVVLLLFFSVSGSQAAIIELTGLTDLQPSDTPGSMHFGVYLTDIGTLPNVDTFTVGLEISGASDLAMPADDVEGPNLADYIFTDNSDSFSTGNPSGALNRMVMGDVTENGSGADLSGGRQLGEITLNYPHLDPGVILAFSLIPGQNFVVSDLDSGYITEELLLNGKTSIHVTPIPGAIWIMGGGLLGLLRLRRWRIGQ